MFALSSMFFTKLSHIYTAGYTAQFFESFSYFTTLWQKSRWKCFSFVIASVHILGMMFFMFASFHGYMNSPPLWKSSLFVISHTQSQRGFTGPHPHVTAQTLSKITRKNSLKNLNTQYMVEKKGRCNNAQKMKNKLNPYTFSLFSQSCFFIDWVKILYNLQKLNILDRSL